jgi:hypothetical protein
MVEFTPPPQVSLKIKLQTLFEYTWKLTNFQRLADNFAISEYFGPYKDWKMSFNYAKMIVYLHNEMGEGLTTKVNFQLHIGKEKSFHKLGSGSHYFTPSLQRCGIDLTGLVDLDLQDLVMKIVIVRQVPVVPLHSHYERFKILFKNSKYGDILMTCQDGEVVAADKAILMLDPYFQEILQVKQSNHSSGYLSNSNGGILANPNHRDTTPPPLKRIGSKTITMPRLKPSSLSLTVNKKQRIDHAPSVIDFSNFSKYAVQSLVEFVYMGTCLEFFPTDVDERYELCILAKYTNNLSLLEFMEQDIVKNDFSFDTIMDVLISLKFKDLKVIRTAACKYFCERRGELKKLKAFHEKFRLISEDLGLLEMLF